MSLFLLIIWGDTEPEIRGPFPTDEARLEAARKHRAEEDTCEKRNGLYRLDTTADGTPTAEPFYGWEMNPEEEDDGCPVGDPSCTSGDGESGKRPADT